ncbi:MAG: S-layer homology domain-containing protein [Clostridia bacterium]|nr:S-layer homology domain-containing protein [Clostridia bacterium]
MKRGIAVIIMLISLMNLLCSVAVASDIFPDLAIQLIDERGRPIVDKDTKEYVYEDHWASRSIVKSVRIGLIEGYQEADGTYVFKPEQAITRAEFIKMAMVLSTNRTFDFDTIPSDINHWAGKYVKVAEMQNVVEKGAYTVANLDEPITRIEMICILSRIQINMKGIEQNRQGNLQYTDTNNLTEEEKALLLHAAKYVLISDMLDTTTFRPNQNLTRAEATVAIMRIY